MNRFVWCFFLIVTIGFAQEQEPENVTIVDDEFEKYFYQALQDKAIENFDKAIISLEKCLEKNDKIVEVYYQLGVNYLNLKKFAEAENNFQKAVDLNNKERWYWNGLYDVYYQSRQFEKAVPIVQKLITFDENMREDLVSLYMTLHLFDKAKNEIDVLENKGNLTRAMEAYRMQIEMMKPKNQVANSTGVLIDAINKNPKVEQNYIDLIFLLSEKGDEQNAFIWAEKMANEIPTSDLAHLGLMKFYIYQKNGSKAIESFTRVAKSLKIDGKLKHRALNEFLIFAQNKPELLQIMNNLLSYFETDSNFNVNKEIAKFFYNKDNFQYAAKYFEQGLKKKEEDLEIIQLLLNVYDFNKEFSKMTSLAENKLDIYPTSADLYYYAGKGNNTLKNFKRAKELLESGLDMVVENKSLLNGFYKQLVITAEGLQNSKMKEEYLKKIKN